MKVNKISLRLIRNYTTLLILFSVVLLSLFFFFLRNQALDIHKTQMMEQGEVIAQNILPEWLESTESTHQKGHMGNMMSGNHMGNKSDYLDLISHLSTDQLFVLDTNGEVLVTSIEENVDSPTMEKDIQQLQTIVLEKEEAVYFRTGSLTDKQQIGYGVPFFNEEEEVIGTVFVLSKESSGSFQTLKEYHLLIWSIVIALIVTVIVSVLMARKFVQPIHDMSSFIDKLIDNSYDEGISIKTKDELAELGEKLSILSQRLKKAKVAQDNKEVSEKLFLSQISHELRTPVMVINNILESLSDERLTEEERRAYLDNLGQETLQLNLLVNDLLELSRLQLTEFSIAKEKVVLNYVIEDSIRSYREIIKEKGQVLSFETKIEEPVFLDGDYQRLVQLMKILIDNAYKYSPNHSQITLVLSELEKEYCLTITNPSSHFLHPIEAGEMFQAFHRGKENQVDGNGLGLTIAEQIVKRHNGRIVFQLISDTQVEIAILFPKESK